MNLTIDQQAKLIDSLRNCLEIAEDAATSDDLPNIAKARRLFDSISQSEGDLLLREALDGLNNWTQGHAEESSKIVCNCCGHHFCTITCECANLINRISRYLNGTNL